ncbi:hypothetical protein SLA2020_463180 [Shorea laevis]
MDGGIDANAPLDYATIQILPSQNRYEAFICANNKVEKLAVGILEKLLPHLPALSSLHAKGYNANYKLQLPPNLATATWFSKATLSRFLHIIGSTDLVDIAKVIEGEMSQLEESRKFHLSLYGQDCFESKDTDGGSSVDMGVTSKSEAQFSSSDASRNELLQAMDLRIAALRRDLVAAFNQAVGPTCSYEEFTHLAKFSENFGATDLKNTLCKFLKLSQTSQMADRSDDNECSQACLLGDNNTCKTDGNSQIPCLKSGSAETPVKYGVSPAKVAQVERQSSTESEESSDLSDGDQTHVERSRTLIRSASPRRSASPMRRVQIGRSGSRRTPALTIKSLNFIPAREKTLSQRDATVDSSEEEGCGTVKKPESNVRRMSVQDAINLFESKQRDQTTDVPKRNSLTNISLGASKTVLRRWSSGQSTFEAVEADVKLESNEERPLSPVVNQAAADTRHGEEINKRVKASAEWGAQKEVELEQMLTKMVVKQPVRSRNVQSNIGPNLPPEQRGGFYDHYKEKRDQKLRGENARKKAEKEAQFRVMQKILDERKAEMVSANVNNMVKKSQKPQALLKNPKGVKNTSQLANPRKETPKPSVVKMVSSKPSSLPVSRRSWPSTPPPLRTSGISPAKTSGGNGISSTGTTSTHKKPQSASSLPRRSPKVERSLCQPRNVNGRQTNNDRSSKVASEKQPQRVTKGSKITKRRVAAVPDDCSSVDPAKSNSCNKVTKKSSVVPVESKPFLRKGSGINSSVSAVNKIINPTPLKDSLGNSEDLTESQESDVAVIASAMVSEIQELDNVLGDPCDAASESETLITTEHQKSDSVENFVELALAPAAAAAAAAGLKNMAEFSSKCEEESIISPSAWVVGEEQQDLSNQCHDNVGELASTVNTAPIGLPSPRVRHSLSQMLQEESSESETIEWGNAENPPAMVYQKDSPRGFKRLLKFARKSKGDANVSGWSSPSIFSEGEDDAEESKAVSKKSADNLLRKAALHAKNYGQQKALLGEGYELNMAANLQPSGESGISRFVRHGSDKSEKGTVPAMGPTTKATRSFFSLSAFKGGKPNEMKLRNLLQDTAHKAGLNLPVYTTMKSGPGHFPAFSCTVVLAGISFTGEPARTKLESHLPAYTQVNNCSFGIG